MIPGGGLARLAGRRRVHYNGDAASSAEHAHHRYSHHHGHAHGLGHHGAAPTGVAGPALAARIRLDEKLRGVALPSTSTTTSPGSPGSRWSRLMRDGRLTASRHPQSPSTRRRDEQEDALLATSGEPEPEPVPWRPTVPPPDPATLLQAAAANMPASTRLQRRAELTRTLSKVDVCAVCLEEVREERQQQRRVTRLPCSHKYHSECVLPWLAIHPDCPCCRALVPSAEA